MPANVAHIVQGAVEFAAEQLIESPVRVAVQRPRRRPRGVRRDARLAARGIRAAPGILAAGRGPPCSSAPDSWSSPCSPLGCAAGFFLVGGTLYKTAIDLDAPAFPAGAAIQSAADAV